jgi:hypothetical protein
MFNDFHSNYFSKQKTGFNGYKRMAAGGSGGSFQNGMQT